MATGIQIAASLLRCMSSKRYMGPAGPALYSRICSNLFTWEAPIPTPAQPIGSRAVEHRLKGLLVTPSEEYAKEETQFVFFGVIVLIFL